MLIKGENSYVSLDEANEWFSGYLYNEAWLASDDEKKERALITSTKILDSYSYKGEPVDPNQKLQMPRNYEYVNAYGLTCKLNPIPQRYIECLYKLVIHLLNNDDILIDTGWVETLKVASIELQKIHRAEGIPSSILEYLSEFCWDVYGFGNKGPIWWRRN